MADANALIRHTDQRTMIQVGGEARNEFVQLAIHFGGSHVAKPECHHARHVSAAKRHDAAKIKIVGQHDTVLGNGFGDDLSIRQALQSLFT